MNKSTRESLLPLIDKEFARLTVKEIVEVEVPNRTYTQTKLKCLCECGRITYVTPSDFIKEQAFSCGCLRQDKMRRAYSILKNEKPLSEMTTKDWLRR